MMSREVDILLIEDNQADVTLTLRAIGEEIMTDRVRVARDGEEALDFLFRRGSHSGQAGIPRLRLILLDLKLGKVSGLEVLAEMKNDPRSKIIPIVVLSSSKQESDVRRSYELGANSYMQKPVNFDEFCDLIRRVAGYWLQLNQAPFLPK
jgi:CheY-like chemotaxis protein